MEFKENEESTQGQTPQDAKTLVNALSQLLLDEPPGTLDTTNTSASFVPGVFANGTSTSTRSLENQRPSSSSADEEEFLPLPGILADSQVRMALRQAAALHNQGPLPDASPTHVPPPFAQHPRFQGERDRRPCCFGFPSSSWSFQISHLNLRAPFSCPFISPRFSVRKLGHPG